MKIKVKATIDPPDDEHCLDPRCRRDIEHCKFMNWKPYLAPMGCEYQCDIYRKRLYKRIDGTIKRPKFCRDSEV